ncbi:ABC transporter permease subunit [Spirosoma utsteinense]|uniref:Spermidine/putrescine transport system permease protein n=1 Tax=Spirosoma utsteinense TaxID=2585773 RepID=A0ABR6W879_9BACT|nr:ABC transporter permease subunit [Spirosoma utsteinense]MBC3784124.1 putative spermidine/putrescine transport system permease protein [Spirosoma utsteinense]MBC3792787.1 putative spermidine/putrescine transport system permease protein [Spirosoma utsteinense]
MNRVILSFYALLIAGLPLAGLINALGYSVGIGGPLATGFTTQYWQQLSTETSLLVSLAFSLYVAISSVGLALLIALALVLNRQRMLRRWPFPALLYVPLLFPSLVVAFYLFQLLSGSGWISRMVVALGLTQTPADFPNLIQDGAGLGIISAQVVMAFPLFTLLFDGLYTDARLDELRSLTRTLGASEGQFNRKVAAPILLRRAAPTLVLYAIAVLGAYDVPLLLGRNYPQMLSVFITARLQRFDLADLPMGYLIGFLLTVGLMIVIYRTTRWTQRHAL